MKAILLLISLTTVVMIGYRAIGRENLVTENGKVDAKTLPLDLKTSSTAYATATFGIG